MQGWERLPTCEQASTEPLQGEHIVVQVVRVMGMAMLVTSIGIAFVFVLWYFGMENLMH
jgi:hypothetical protein